MVNSLRKVDFLHPTGHYTCKKKSSPPLEKILGAPLIKVNAVSFCYLSSVILLLIGAEIAGDRPPPPLGRVIMRPIPVRMVNDDFTRREHLT